MTASPALKRDGEGLIDTLRQGQPIRPPQPLSCPAVFRRRSSLPPPKTISPRVFQTLTEMYQRQAELRVELVPTILTPLLLLLIAGLVGFVLLALLLPLLQLISGISGGNTKF